MKKEISSARFAIKSVSGFIFCILAMIFACFTGFAGVVALVPAIFGFEVGIQSARALKHIRENPVDSSRQDGWSTFSLGWAALSTIGQLIAMVLMLVILAGLLLFVGLQGWTWWSLIGLAGVPAYIVLKSRLPKIKPLNFTRHRVRKEDGNFIWNLHIWGSGKNQVLIPASSVDDVRILDSVQTGEFEQVHESARLGKYKLQQARELYRWQQGEIPFPRYFLSYSTTSYISEQYNVLLTGPDLFWLVSVDKETAELLRKHL